MLETAVLFAKQMAIRKSENTTGANCRNCLELTFLIKIKSVAAASFLELPGEIKGHC